LSLIKKEERETRAPEIYGFRAHEEWKRTVRSTKKRRKRKRWLNPPRLVHWQKEKEKRMERVDTTPTGAPKREGERRKARTFKLYRPRRQYQYIAEKKGNRKRGSP